MTRHDANQVSRIATPATPAPAWPRAWTRAAILPRILPPHGAGVRQKPRSIQGFLHVSIARTPPNRYARQVSLPRIGLHGQNRLAASRVLLVGCGALGTHIADSLARAGVGYLRLLDRDFVELNNLQRQILFDERDVTAGLPKAVAASRRLATINSAIEIEAIADDLNASNVAEHLQDVDLVIDGTDNFETRYLLNDAAVRGNVPWIYGGVIATHGLTMTIVPGVTACLRCAFRDPAEPGSAPTCESAGVLGPAVALVAAIQASEALKLLVGAVEEVNNGLFSVDIWTLEITRLRVPRDESCPACGLGPRTYPFLELKGGSRTTVLCGRDSVQVTLQPSTRLSLEALATRFRATGQVRQNEHLVRLQVDGKELIVFPNGRILVHGTADPAVARGLVARYVGL